ncbi:MAG: methyltransferase [Bdellovibrio sp.]|nr:MAG: methyltransferase [Bdellovibrio sp.]
MPPLHLVSTPIGHPDDFTLRGLATLRRCPIVIVEERKESTAWLRQQGIAGKQIEILNEHSTPQDLDRLMKICREHEVSLITDAGTPGFCDPGAELVRRCRTQAIPVRVYPGASSLMSLLSLSGEPLEEFYFRGFLPAKSEDRRAAWMKMQKSHMPIILMDTPYRLRKFLGECGEFIPSRRILLALNLTQDDELVIEALGRELAAKVHFRKAEFICLVYQS